MIGPKEIIAARERLGDLVRRTPVVEAASSCGAVRDALAGEDAEAFWKLELFQHAGSFKPRGALTRMLALDDAARRRGVTAVSAGNHAIAVAYAARALGTTAKVVMPQNADPFRIARVRDFGGEVELVADVHAAFERVEEIEREEGRAFVHPFDGPEIVLGTATLGLEITEQLEPCDAVVVPIGGGGLCAGVASAIRGAWPGCRVIGVEPEGADTMHRSFAAGEPRSIDAVRTIADSLGAPFALPHTYAICRDTVDELVRVSDDELRSAMRVLFEDAKIAVEPAGAATTAALLGPLRGRLDGRVVLIVCGANIGPQRFFDLLQG